MQLGQELDDQDPPREKNGLPPMVNIMKIASAKSQSTRGAYHQPTFMGNSLTISETCLLFPRSRWVKCFQAPYDWANGGSVDAFFGWWAWFYFYVELMLF